MSIYDSDAVTFFANHLANDGTITADDKIRVSNLFRAFKYRGLWSKIPWFWSPVGTFGGVFTKMKFPGGESNQLVNHNFVSGDYTPNGANGGLKGDASTKSCQTGYVDSTGTLTDFSMGAYISTPGSLQPQAAMGALVSGSALTLLRDMVNFDGSEASIGSLVGTSPGAMTTGLFTATRSGAVLKGYIGATAWATNNAAAGAFAGLEMHLFGVNVGGSAVNLTDATIGFAFIGTGLTPTDLYNLNQIVTIFRGNLGKPTDRATSRGIFKTLFDATVKPANQKVPAGGPNVGVTIWDAAPTYKTSAIADMWRSTDSYPASWSDADIKSTVDVYAGNVDGSGNFINFAFDQNIGGNWTQVQCGDLNPDVTNHRPVGDATWFVPLLCIDYYNRNPATHISLFNTYKAAMETNLGTIPINGATHLVTINNAAATLWRDNGFTDGLDNCNPAGAGTSDVLAGSVFYWKAAKAMAALYTAAGDAASAATWTTRANNVASNLTAALYDNVSGMFFACTSGGNSTNIDVFYSALAAYWGLATPTQTANIAAWLVANYTTIVDENGFVRKSPTAWGQIRGNQPPNAGCYDDGAWAEMVMAVVWCLRQADPNFADMLLATAANGPDASQEWYRAFGSLGDTGTGLPHGATNNLCTTAQFYGASLLTNNSPGSWWLTQYLMKGNPMIERTVQVGSTKVLEEVFCRDTSVTSGQAGLTNLAFNTGGLVAGYFLKGASAKVAITPITATLGTWAGSASTAGLVKVDDTDLPGLVEVSMPDAMFAKTGDAYFFLLGAANMEAVMIHYTVRAGNF